MGDSICHHEKFGYCKFKDQIKFFKNKHQTSCKRFLIKISCRFGSSCAYVHLDHSG